MSEYLSGLKKQLISARDPNERSGIASDIGYFIESAMISGDKLKPATVVAIANVLIKILMVEKNHEVRISALYALIKASCYLSDAVKKFNADTIVKNLEAFNEEEMDYVLEILGFSGDLRYLPILKQYENSKNEDLKVTAKAAIEELLFTNTKYTGT